MNIKTILGATAVAVAGSAFLGKGQYDKYKNVADQMDFQLKNVKDIKFSNGNALMKVDVELINPTPTAVNIPGKQITIRDIHFYSKTWTKLGTANVNISEIALPANGSRLITNIPVTISLANIGKNFSEIWDIMIDTSTLEISADLEAFGKSFTVNS